MLSVHRSSSATALADALAGLLAAPPEDPFALDVVAVPAQGVERWLAQRLAHSLGAGEGHDGVCAGVLFPRPGALLDELAGQACPAWAAATAAWEPERASFALLGLLEGCLDEPWCAVLRAHLRRDGADAERGWAVSRRLVGLWARAGAERPGLLRSWAEGGDGGVPADQAWQPRLWRGLRDALGPAPAELLEQACAAVAASEPSAGRVAVFGASRLSAARLQLLTALAQRQDVALLVHHASPALWQALEGVRPASGLRAASDAAAATAVAHPLLASLGRDVRELQLRLAEAAPGAAAHLHEPDRVAPRTLLEHLQAGLRAGALPAVPAAQVDRSVQVHACHGRARQVEVLREVVLGLLADDPSLEPRDVLVLCPDVEAFAPLVTAAFGAPGHPGSGLRVSLADRAPGAVNPLLAVASGLLDLAGSRVTAAQVLDLLGAEPVRRAAGLDDDALERVRGWVVEAGVRWGLDAAGRTPWRLQGVEQGTWRAGLDRVLAGVVAGEEDGLVGGLLPLGGLDATDAELAGRLAELLDRLDAALTGLTGPQPAAAWAGALERAVDLLTEVGPDGAWQVVQLSRLLEEVRTAAGGQDAALALADARALLARRLEAVPTRSGFRTGGLTVCTLVPMRSVPHRVVCLLGLDDGAFPRAALPDGDDPLAAAPRTGERDPRSEDRQLLLDALSACRETLVVTYDGADVRSGTARPPAVPLGELLDALEATAPGAREGVVVRHPLQPTAPANFTPGALGRPAAPLSFDRTALRGARAAVGGRTAPPPFLAGPLPPLPPGDVELGRLVELLVHPARGFLRQRLDVAGPGREEEPEASLPVELGPLERWAVGDRVLRARLAGVPVDEVRALERARGALPPPPLGDALLARCGREVEAVLERCGDLLGAPAASVEVDALVDGRRLTGLVGTLRGGTLLTVTFSRPGASQRLRAWVELLAAVASGAPVEGALLVGTGRSRPVASALQAPDAAVAGALLAELLALRDLGLQQVLPLPVGAASAYADGRRAGDGVGKARAAAARSWESGFERRGEDAAAEHLLVHGGAVPFDAVWDAAVPGALPGHGWEAEPTAFAVLARRVWEPVRDHERAR